MKDGSAGRTGGGALRPCFIRPLNCCLWRRASAGGRGRATTSLSVSAMQVLLTVHAGPESRRVGMCVVVTARVVRRPLALSRVDLEVPTFADLPTARADG